MMFTSLVQRRFCKTPIHVSIGDSELSEDGELVPAFEVDTLCNLQMGARASFTKDKEAVEIAGLAYFIGDLCPDVGVITNGSVEVDGMEYSINKGQKHLNPDGTINFTTLELV